MSARRTAIQLATKATIGFAALFLVSVLLAAMPGHHAPTVGSAVAPEGAVQEQAPAQPDHSIARKTKSRGRHTQGATTTRP